MATYCATFQLVTTMEEVLIASRQIKNGKACSPDGRYSKVLRDPELLLLLHPILNSVFSTCQPPSEFLLNRIVALPKKGDLSQHGSYRGISLLSCAAKLFNRILLNWIREPVEKLLRTNQNGFRRHRSTLEPILTLRRLIEETSAKKNVSLCAVFVDFAKAFDSIDRKRMFEILSAYGIPCKIMNAIRCVYDNSHSFVSTQERDSIISSTDWGSARRHPRTFPLHYCPGLCPPWIHDPRVRTNSKTPSKLSSFCCISDRSRLRWWYRTFIRPLEMHKFSVCPGVRCKGSWSSH